MMKTSGKNINTENRTFHRSKLRKWLAGFLAASTAFTMLSGSAATLFAEEPVTEYALAGAGSGEDVTVHFGNGEDQDISIHVNKPAEETDGVTDAGVPAVEAGELVTISTVDGSDLPQEAEASGEVLTGKKEAVAVEKVEAVAEAESEGAGASSAADPTAKESVSLAGAESSTERMVSSGAGSVQETEAPTAEKTEYQVFDISLDNVNEKQYEEGFKVEVNLPEEVTGKDFRLYHIHEGQEPVDITDSLNLVSKKDKETGMEVVSGFEFVTDGFSEFVLKYTVDFAITNPETGEKYAWSWPGYASYKVADILAEVGIEGEISDVQLERTIDVGGSAAVLYLEEKEDGWYLTSDEAFQDTFELTVTVGDKKYVVVVTDDVSSAVNEIEINFVDADGNPDQNATLGSTAYYIVIANANDTNCDYFAPVVVSGSKASIGSFTDSNNNSVDSVTLRQWNPICFITWSGANPLTVKTIRDRWNWDESGELQKISDNMLGVYAIGNIPLTPDNSGKITISAVKKPSHSVEVSFMEANGSPSVPSGNYYLYAAVKKPYKQNGQDLEGLFFSVSGPLSIGNDGKAEGSIVNFTRANADPISYPYDSGEQSFTVKLVKSSANNFVNTNDQHYGEIENAEVVENGSVVDDYYFTVSRDGDKTTFIGQKQAPYEYMVKTSDNARIDFDTGYTDNWYILSSLTKADGSGSYHYIAPVSLNGQSTVTGTIPTYYYNVDPSKITIGGETTGNGTTSSVYTPGDEVTTVLFHMIGNQTTYDKVLQPLANQQTYGEIYENNSGANKYTVNTSDVGGHSTITLTKAVNPIVHVAFRDINGTTPDEAILSDDEYYLYVNLDRGRGKEHYGYVTKIDIAEADKDYEIPYFNNAVTNLQEEGSDRAYLTADYNYSAYIVHRHEGAPTVYMCQKEKGVILYDEGSHIEETVFHNTDAKKVDVTKRNSTLTVQNIPKLQMNAEFSVDNVSNASAVTGYYYLLVTMTDNNGNKYYHLQKLDPSENPIASTIVGAFQTAGDDGNHYYYTGDQDISVSVVTSNSDSLSVYNAVNGNGCSVFSKNALTGDGYKLSYNLNETDHVLSVNLEKKTLTANPFNAKFTFYTAKNSDIVSKPLKPALGSGYYMLATIMSDDQAIAYSIVPVDTDSLTSANSNGVLSLSLLESTQYNMIDALGKEVSGKTVRFDPSQFNMVVRLYHRDSLPETYLSAKAGDDTVTGYDFWETIPAEDGKSVQVKLYQAYKKKYQVKVHFSDTKNISDNDKLHIKVEAVHATTGTDIYETDISGTELSDWITVIEDRTGNNSISNWNTLGTNTNIFSGNEKVTITLSRKGKNLADGELAYDYVVHYDTPEREEIVDDVNHVTTITDCVTLTKVKSSHDYDYYSILGGGVGFGITADYLFQNGHAQTNFAVNKYYGNNIIEPDLAGHGAIIVIADYELKEGKALEIGGSHVDGTQTVIYLGGDNPGLDLVRNVEQRDWVHVIESTTEDLMYNMVEPIINHMEEISAELLTHETTIHPAPNSENKMYIDLLDFPEDATIYLDGDELRDWIAKGNDGLYITKHKNQMIVFNFDSTEEATIGQYHVQYAPDEDGTYHSGNYFHTESPTGKGDAKNVFADYLAQHVVYNLNSVKDIVVDTNVGMILVPRDDSSMNIKGTSAGWIISDGYVTNTGAEWHSVYAEMPDSSTVDLAAFKIVDDKTPTANQVFSFKLEKLGDNKEWNTVETKQNVNRTVRFTQISGDGLANGWNVFRITEVGKASGTQGNYNMDERKIYAFVRYFDLGNGGVKIAGSPRYYMTTTSEEHPEVYFDENSFNKEKTNFVDAIGSGNAGVGLRPVTLQQFENEVDRNGLEIQKTVTGSQNQDARFIFVIKLWFEGDSGSLFDDFNENTNKVSYPITGIEGQQEIEFSKVTENNGVYARAELTLKGNSTAVITGIPANVHYSVTEVSTIADVTDVDKDDPVGFEGNKSNGYTNSDLVKSGIISGTGSTVVSFTNNYEASGEYPLAGTKKLHGRNMVKDEFKFVVKEGDRIVANGTVPAGDADEPKDIVWSPNKLTFNQDNVGIHTYTIEEDLSNLPDGVTPIGNTKFELTLNVADNKAGELTVTPTGTIPEIAFVNSAPINIDIIKIDEATRDSANQKKLTGASFRLLKYNETNKDYVAYDSTYGSEEGVEVGTTGDTAGKLTFSGLPDGEYKIHETKVPAGYIKVESSDIFIKIEGGVITRYDKGANETNRTVVPQKTNVEGQEKEYVFRSISYMPATDNTNATFTVGNTSGAVLPATGGEGTRRLILMGILLIALAGAGLVMIRRRREMTR